MPNWDDLEWALAILALGAFCLAVIRVVLYA
jgi:hypothetical protein